MHKFIKNICRKGSLFLFRGMLFAFPMLVLTACTGKEDVVLNLSDADSMQETDELTETEADTLIENAVQLPDNTLDTAQSEIYVHICGAVVNPGVYKLDEGSRVFEGIEAAGGFEEDACEDYVNLAGCLKDGERIVIPTKEEIEEAKADGSYQVLWAKTESDMATEETGASGSGAGLVNINTATESELGSISGIGAGKAAAIVQYRQENGSFASIEDIMKVSGIKEGTYDKIKDKITVN